MFELAKNAEVKKLIAITKSDSGVVGPELANAHMSLGHLMGKQMVNFAPDDTTIIAILRGGLFFAIGMYLE